MFYQYNIYRKETQEKRQLNYLLQSKILRDIVNSENKQLLVQFFDFMKRAGTSEKYQNNNLKALITYSKFLGPSISFYEVENKNQVISFLDTKIKNSEDDPDKR
ncbi:MAG TPA: hypothetical protein VIQ04_03720 [Nitrososphaeraceae archaeon]